MTLLLNWAAAFGQEKVLILPGKLPTAQMDIGPYTSFYEDPSGDTLPLSVIRRQQFRPFAEKRNERTTFSDQSVMVTWLRFTLRNAHPTDTLRLLHYTGVHGHVTLYETGRPIGHTGIFYMPKARPSPFALPLTIPPATTRTYIVRVFGYIWHPHQISSTLMTVSESITNHFGPKNDAEKLLLAAMSLLTGGLMFMSLYSLYSFIISRNWAYLFYTLYTGTSVLFSLHHMNYKFTLDLVFPHRVSDDIGPFHVALITAFYILFVVDILAVRANFPRTWRVLSGLLILLAAQEILAVVEWIYGYPLFASNSIYTYAMVPSGLATAILLATVIRSQSPIRIYLLIGILSLLGISFIPGSLGLYSHNISPIFASFFNDPFFWVIMGLAIEAFCFALARAYLSRLIAIQNRQIQVHYTQDLEIQLAQRTYEIEQQSRMMEQQHIRQLETEFEQKLADTEMTALRAQMNPHFIFNCLNSIKLYTLDNEADKASDYLTKFSRLIRLVLENSRSELVPLQNELEALQLYIELEAMRFKQKVQFTIQVSPGIDQRYV
ncbi:histidine kinase, partial [Persicitalea sp.]|uniref:histidine kinase n=1 Tax=Persicitalea sp. TaxID=3100273 RepID=UPI0035946E8C